LTGRENLPAKWALWFPKVTAFFEKAVRRLTFCTSLAVCRQNLFFVVKSHVIIWVHNVLRPHSIIELPHDICCDLLLV